MTAGHYTFTTTISVLASNEIEAERHLSDFLTESMHSQEISGYAEPQLDYSSTYDLNDNLRSPATQEEQP